MKKRALRKDFRVEIRKSLNRFLSIFFIVALGVAFFSGIQSTAPDMRLTADHYFDESSLCDLRIVGTYGLTEEDVAALSALPAIERVQAGYMTDVLWGEEASIQVLHVESLFDGMNLPVVKEGRLPEGDGECFLDDKLAGEGGCRLGDVLTFNPGEDEDSYALKSRNYTVVGIGSSPEYISFSRGSSTLGNGEVAGFVVVCPEAFDQEVYSLCYADVAGARELTAYTGEYDDLVAAAAEEAESIADVRCQARYEEVRAEADEKLSDGREEIAEAESELADARQQLADGRADADKELSDSRHELKSGQAALAEGKSELAEARQTLADGEAELAEGKAELNEKSGELTDARGQLDEGWTAYRSGLEQLQQGLAQYNLSYPSASAKLSAGSAALAQSRAELESAKAQYASGLEQLAQAESELEAGKSELAAGKTAYETQYQTYTSGLAQYEAGAGELAQKESEYNVGAAAYAQKESEYNAGAAEYATKESEYNAGMAAYTQKESEYNAGADAYAQKESEYNAGAAEYATKESEYNAGAAAYAEKESEYNAGMAAYTQKESEYNAGMAAYAEQEAAYTAGKTAYDTAKAEYDAGAAAAAEQETAYLAGETDYTAQAGALAAKKSECETAAAALAQKETDYSTKKAAYDSGLAAYNQGVADADAQQAALDGQRAAYNANLASLEALRAELAALQEKINAGTATEEETARAGAIPGEITALEGQTAGVGESLDAAQAQIDGTRAALAATKTALDGEKTALDGALADLETSRTAVAAAQAEVTAAEASLAAYRTELDSAKAELDTVKATLAATKTALDAEKATLDAGKTALDGAKAELDAGKTALDGAKATLDAGKTELDAGKAELDAGKTALDGAKATLDAGKAALESGKTELDAGKAALDAGKATLAAKKTELDAGKAALDAAKAQLDGSEQQLLAGETQLAAESEKLSGAQAQIAAGTQQIAQAESEIAAGYRELAAAKAELDGGQAELNTSKATLDEMETKYGEGAAQLEEGKNTLAEAEQELADGWADYSDGYRELTDKERELLDGWKKYYEGAREARREIAENEQKIADGEEELADARQELAEGEEEIAKLKQPEWYVSDRSVFSEYSGYGENAERITNIGKVFPVIFFLVAALISLTTMTRMVEEQRVQIGTLKALGYGNSAIAGKYLKYALYATLGGGVFGILIGEKIIPYIIVISYGIMYADLKQVVMPYEGVYSLMAVGVSLVCTIGAAYSACKKELRSTPAVLMRPPSPKQGKRVLLEYLPFIWRRMGFIWKSTVRNLFRYKKRFLMTVFGISGCMGLLLVGFGIRDSIMNIGYLQYGQIQMYEGLAVLDPDADESDRAEANAYLDSETRVAHKRNVYMKKVTADSGKKSQELYLYVPEETDGLDTFIRLHDRVSQTPYDLGEEGVILTEKTAKMLGVKAGDQVTIREDGREASVTVGKICENYMYHYLYLSPEVYRSAFGSEPDYGSIAFVMAKDDEEAERRVGESLLALDGVINVTYTNSIADQLDRMLGSLDIVIAVLIISAGMLAFVVLYNLNNINVNERRRELATLKVLGFYDGEVSAYVYRENVLLTVIGAAVGCLVGKLLHQFIIVTVEVDVCMFGRNVEPISYLYSILFTVGFSVFVNAVMHIKLKKIDMVESLKSVE